MTPPLSQPLSYPARLRALALQRGEAEAVRFLGRDGSETVTSWAGLNRLVEHLAGGLMQRGIGQGDIVGIALGNVTEHLALALAVWRLGATTLVMDPSITPEAAASLVARSGARIAVGLDVPVAELMAADPVEPMPDRVSCPAKIVLSGGSTGLPKMMCDTRPHVRVPGASWGRIAPALGFRADQVQLVCGAMSHNAPFTWAQNGLFEGNRIVLMEKFDAERALQAIDRLAVGFVMLVPTMMVRMLDADGRNPARLDSLHTLYHTGAPCAPWLKRAWIDRLGAARVSEMYGSGENTGQTVVTGAEWLARPGTVGRGFETEIRIRDAAGLLLPAGTPGEVFMRPDDPTGRSEYFGPDAPLPRRDDDGFQSIGDSGWLDAEGYLYLSGRSDDVINSGGAKLHPEAIEAALLRHPDVMDVAVFGVADREWGQRVAASVVARPGTVLTAAALDSFARLHLTREETPKDWHFADALPRDGFGKLRRRILMGAG